MSGTMCLTFIIHEKLLMFMNNIMIDLSPKNKSTRKVLLIAEHTTCHSSLLVIFVFFLLFASTTKLLSPTILLFMFLSVKNGYKRHVTYNLNITRSGFFIRRLNF